MLGGPKIRNGGKKGVVIELAEVRRAQNAPKLLDIFKGNSSYAISINLAQQLSRDLLFKSMVAGGGIKSITHLGDILVNRDRPLCLEKVDENAAIQLFNRILVEEVEGEEKDVAKSIISNHAEMGIEENKLAGQEVEVYLEGEERLMYVRTIEEHMEVLRGEGRVERLKHYVEDRFLDECVTAALAELAYFNADYVRDFLREVSLWEDQRISLRAMHSLAFLGCDDIKEKIIERGDGLIRKMRVVARNTLSDRSHYGSDLLLVFLSLAYLKESDKAVKFFRRLNKQEQEKLIQEMKKDDYPIEVHSFALTLESIQELRGKVK